MPQARDRTYRALRIVEACGLQGCTPGDLAAKLYARRATGPRRNGPAAHLLNVLANAGYLLRIGSGGNAVFHVAAAGRTYMTDAHNAALAEADGRARARQAPPSYDGGYR